MADDNQIYFIVEEPIPESEETVRGERGSRDTGGGWGRGPNRVDPIRTRKKRISIKSSLLKAQLQDMKNVIDELFTQDEQTQNLQNAAEQNATEQNAIEQSGAKKSANGMQLEEITLSVQVNAKGELGILGTGGELGGSGGITLKFARPKS
ncbi:MAG: hypothetical protein AB8B99_19095 [Phormidesmis sp.]